MVYLSIKYVTLHGLSSTEMIQKIKDIYANPTEIIRRIQEIIAQGNLVLGEEVVMRTGQVYIVDFIPLYVEGKHYGHLWKHTEITERKKSEELIRLSEEKFSKAFHSSPDAILISRISDGQLLDVNPGFCSISGYTKEESIGSSTILLNLWENPQDRDTVISSLRSKKTVYNYEFNFRHKLGKILTCTYSGELIYIDNEMCILSTVRDITKSKQTEHHQYLAFKVLSILNDISNLTDSIKLILDEIKQETGFEAVGIRLRSSDDFPYFVTTGFPGYFVEAEESLCGYTEDGEVILDSSGKPVLECMCGNVICGRTNSSLPFFTDGGSFWSNNTTELLNSTTEEDRQTRTRNRCNGEGYESVALIPIRANREIVGLLQLNDKRKDCFTLDIIHFFERISASIGMALLNKQTTELLRISEDKFNKAFFLSPDAISISRIVDGMFILVNDGFKQFSGYVEEELVGKTALEINIWDNLEDRNKLITGLKTEGKVNNFEFRFRTKNRDIRHGLTSASLIELNGENHLLSITRDVTEHKLLEQEKIILRNKLFQIQKLETVGTLAAGIAHDFNNLLTVIIGYSDILLTNKIEGDPEYKELKNIEITARTAADLVQSIREVGGSSEINQVLLDLNIKIIEVINLLSSNLPDNIDLQLFLSKVPLVINADSSHMNRVIMNLIMNSIEAMPDGGILTIQTNPIVIDDSFCKLHVGLIPGSYVVLSIIDTGSGINPSIIEKIFDPFFSTKPKDYNKGTGLGLSIVRGIVGHHEGCVICESEVNVGTTFKVYLPLNCEIVNSDKS